MDSILRQFSLEDVKDLLFLAGLHFLCQFDHFVLQHDDSFDIPAEVLRLKSVNLDNLSANYLDFIVRSTGNLINEVSNC